MKADLLQLKKDKLEYLLIIGNISSKTYFEMYDEYEKREYLFTVYLN